MLIIKSKLVTFNLFTIRQIKLSGGWLVLLKKMQLLFNIWNLNSYFISNRMISLGLTSCNIDQEI